MYITIEQNLECSECGAVNHIEHFSTATHRGIRCLKCGHEQKTMHPHLQETQSGGTASWSQNSKTPTKF